MLLGLYNEKKDNRRASPKGTGAVITTSRSVHLTTLDVVNDKIPRWTPKTARERLNAKQRELVQDKPPVNLPRAVTVQFGEIVQLIGVDDRKNTAKPGEKVTWTFFYKALKDAPRWTGMFTHIVGPKPKTSHYHNAVHTPVLGGLPVHEWRAGEYVTDPHTFAVPKHFPPGDYDVWLGFWDPNLQKPRNRYKPVSATVKPDPESRVRVGTLKIRSAKP